MALVTFKALNDGTRGFRFNIIGKRGIFRMRKIKIRRFEIERKETFSAIHFRKFTLHVESKRPRELGKTF